MKLISDLLVSEVFSFPSRLGQPDTPFQGLPSHGRKKGEAGIVLGWYPLLEAVAVLTDHREDVVQDRSTMEAILEVVQGCDDGLVYVWEAVVMPFFDEVLAS